MFNAKSQDALFEIGFRRSQRRVYEILQMHSGEECADFIQGHLTDTLLDKVCSVFKNMSDIEEGDFYRTVKDMMENVQTAAEDFMYETGSDFILDFDENAVREKDASTLIANINTHIQEISARTAELASSYRDRAVPKEKLHYDDVRAVPTL